MPEATLPMAVARRPDDRRAFSRVASMAVLALGLCVLAGWRLEPPGLRSGVTGLVRMNHEYLGPLIEKPFTVQGILQKVRDALSMEHSDA
jgi:hypothetical protein